MNNEVNDYFLGLDIGTDSVGWAVTDMQYHILRRKGKSLWGVRLFDAANTAAERRIINNNASKKSHKIKNNKTTTFIIAGIIFRRNE